MYAHKILYMMGSMALGGAGAYSDNPILIFASILFMAGTSLTFLEYEGDDDCDEIEPPEDDSLDTPP